MSSCGEGWEEEIVRVQSVSESGLVPERYKKPPGERACISMGPGEISPINIPLIDVGELLEEDDDDDDDVGDIDDIHERWSSTKGKGKGKDRSSSSSVYYEIMEACREWGFFQVVNHGVRSELMERALEVWYNFFHLSPELKEVYANSPKTYEGYGSRLGVEKGAILDWNDYYYLHYLPCSLKDHTKWPALPHSLREVMEEYMGQLVKLCGVLQKVLSKNLGLEEDYLQNAFGGSKTGACLRVNFYPKCPQPHLTLGLSSHSDPGGITVLLPDQHVQGLQVRKDANWITVKPAPHAFIVNIGDQIQVLSNATYKSVEHRVTVNSNEERVSLAFFYNPNGDLLIQPAEELVTPDKPPLYPPMTFNEYRLYIRTRGPQGKSQVESLKSPR